MSKFARVVATGALALSLGGCVTINVPAESSSDSAGTTEAAVESSSASSEAQAKPEVKTAEFMGFTMDVPATWTPKNMDKGTMYTGDADGEDSEENNYISVTYLEPNHGQTFESIDFFLEDSVSSSGIATSYTNVIREEIDGAPFMSATETVTGPDGTVEREGRKAAFVTDRGDLTVAVIYCDGEDFSGYLDQVLDSIQLT